MQQLQVEREVAQVELLLEHPLHAKMIFMLTMRRVSERDLKMPRSMMPPLTHQRDTASRKLLSELSLRLSTQRVEYTTCFARSIDDSGTQSNMSIAR